MNEIKFNFSIGELNSKPEWNQTILLSGGRKLGFADYGDPDGEPFLYCHGFPGSRLEAAPIDEAAKKLSARIIAADRPGFGLSDFQNNRKILDFPNDITELMNRLSVNEFSIAGVSGGAPYALSCISKIPDRIKAASIICGLGPYSFTQGFRKMSLTARIFFRLSSSFPYLASKIINQVGKNTKKNTSSAMDYIIKSISEPDKSLLKQKDFRGLIQASLKEAFRNAGRGAAHDLFLYTQPWGFDLSKISGDVLIYHGTEDRIVPLVFSEYLKKTLPHSEIKYFTGEGHFTLPANFHHQLLQEMMEKR